MIQLCNRYATPLLTGFFTVTLVTGTALFFHIGPQAFRGLHEWLSLALLLPFALHLWKNWRPMRAYFRHAPMAIALALTAAAALPFLLPTGEGATAGGPPAFRFAATALHNPVAEVAPLLGLDAQALTARLATEGYRFDRPDQPLDEVAVASGKDGNALMALLLAEAG